MVSGSKRGLQSKRDDLLEAFQYTGICDIPEARVHSTPSQLVDSETGNHQALHTGAFGLQIGRIVSRMSMMRSCCNDALLQWRICAVEDHERCLVAR